MDESIFLTTITDNKEGQAEKIKTAEINRADNPIRNVGINTCLICTAKRPIKIHRRKVYLRRVDSIDWFEHLEFLCTAECFLEQSPERKTDR